MVPVPPHTPYADAGVKAFPYTLDDDARVLGLDRVVVVDDRRGAFNNVQYGGARCQVSGVRCQESGVRCQVSGVRWQCEDVHFSVNILEYFRYQYTE